MALQLAAIFMGTVVACSDTTLPTPKVGSHSGDELIVVPYPPPPARVEIIPARPTDKRSVWIDGEWVFQAQRWSWQAGLWVVPDPRAYYAPPTTVRLSDGTLVWFAGTWHTPRAAGGK